MEKKYFTVDEANQLLPYVQSELAFLQETKTDFYRKYHELQLLKKQNDPSNEDAIFKMECSLEFMELEVQMHIDSIHTKGIQVKDIDIGLIDFPAIVDGEEVLLCWQLGESNVSFYHGVNDGFAGRKRIE